MVLRKYSDEGVTVDGACPGVGRINYWIDQIIAYFSGRQKGSNDC